MTKDKNVPVEQVDRDAAADFLEAIEPDPAIKSLAHLIRQGRGDKDSPIVQAFALHRAAATRQASADLEEALEGFLTWRDRVQAGDGVHYLNGERPPFGNGDNAWDDLDALATKARAILARHRKEGGV